MVSKALMGVWFTLDLLLLGAGGMTVALAVIWQQPDVARNMVLSTEFLTAGIALGVALLVTFAISIGGIVQRSHVTIGLMILNWALVVDSLAIVVIGTFLWVFTLQERSNFHAKFSLTSPETRLTIQNKFSCCGYFNATDFGEVGGFCTDTAFMAANTTVNCVKPLTEYADMTLNTAFTTVYGFMAVVISLFLATMCVIKKRNEDERFKKIDSKRGGRGFV